MMSMFGGQTSGMTMSSGFQVFNELSVYKLLSDIKPNQRQQISIKMDDLDKYFPKSFTPKQRTDTIIKLLENWSKEREKKKDRER